MKILNLTETFTHREPLSKLVSYCAIRLRQVFYVGLSACLLLLPGAAARPVLAQAATTVSFSPVPVVIDTRVANNAVVTIMIDNAINIGAFDIQINYDPKVAQVGQWALGGFLSDAFCLVPVDIPGSLRLACTITGKPGYSGSGTLVTLTLEALAWGGSSVLSFSKAELVESETFLIVNPRVEPGELCVIPYHIAFPLILKQSSPQTFLVPVEALSQASSLQKLNQFPLALPGCNKALS